jgi:NADPH-dependent glutamate synthase beta subunit-like oxidoreductase
MISSRSRSAVVVSGFGGILRNTRSSLELIGAASRLIDEILVDESADEAVGVDVANVGGGDVGMDVSVGTRWSNDCWTVVVVLELSASIEIELFHSLVIFIA